MDKSGSTSYEKAYGYIFKNSPQNAVKVLEDIVKAVHKADKNPAYYNPDKYKINNDGSYRAFKKHKYRIVYRFTEKAIRVLRVRHTKMEPKEY
jgi:plasmid stabilization system protein ParE